MHASTAGMLLLLVMAVMSVISEATYVEAPLQRRAYHGRSAWVWRCYRSNCVRYAGGSGTGQSFSSQDECALLCGRPTGPLWPKPTGPTRLGTQLVAVDVTMLGFSSNHGLGPATLLLEDMRALFAQELHLLACGHLACSADNTTYRPMYLRVHVHVEDWRVNALEWGTNETYSLQVSTEMTEKGRVLARVYAGTVFGARHGLQTLTQLMARGQGTGYLLMLGDVQVTDDRPKYTHRGVMLDTARHFLPTSALRRTIDAMASCKLNTLHLHLSDSHSFPVRSQRVPQMAAWGAYSEEQSYSLEELALLAQYALRRGVRLIPELDAPAHAGNGWQWGPREGFGELAVCVNQQPWREACIQPPCGQLNPGNPHVYRILGHIYSEIQKALSPHADTVFHMGGDEVKISCWQSSDNVTSWIASQPGHAALTDQDYHWAWEYFQEQALQKLDMAYNGTKPAIILWSSALTEPEIILHTLDPARYVVQTWVPGESALPLQLLELGYRVIISHKDAWYLDHGFWGITTYASWRKVYRAGLPTAALGGEVALWTELVDEESLDALLWPRAAAVAERLWSDPLGVQEETGTEARLLRWRRRAVKTRGIGAAAISPGWCELHEGQCL